MSVGRKEPIWSRGRCAPSVTEEACRGVGSCDLELWERFDFASPRPGRTTGKQHTIAQAMAQAMARASQLFNRIINGGRVGSSHMISARQCMLHRKSSVSSTRNLDIPETGDRPRMDDLEAFACAASKDARIKPQRCFVCVIPADRAQRYFVLFSRLPAVATEGAMAILIRLHWQCVARLTARRTSTTPN